MVNVDNSIQVVDLMFQSLSHQPIRLDTDLLTVPVAPLDGHDLRAFDITSIARQAQAPLLSRPAAVRLRPRYYRLGGNPQVRQRTWSL